MLNNYEEEAAKLILTTALKSCLRNIECFEDKYRFSFEIPLEGCQSAFEADYFLMILQNMQRNSKFSKDEKGRFGTIEISLNKETKPFVLIFDAKDLLTQDISLKGGFEERYKKEKINLDNLYNSSGKEGTSLDYLDGKKAPKWVDVISRAKDDEVVLAY